jgi:hypothetical protein|nr:MAG TPA: Methanosarcina acetivorans protoglobin fold, protoglobin, METHANOGENESIS, ARCHAEA [Caudoviricetes sp.]
MGIPGAWLYGENAGIAMQTASELLNKIRHNRFTGDDLRALRKEWATILNAIDNMIADVDRVEEEHN